MYPRLLTSVPQSAEDTHTPSDPPPSYDVAISSYNEPSAPPQTPSSLEPYQTQPYPQTYPLPLSTQPQPLHQSPHQPYQQNQSRQQPPTTQLPHPPQPQISVPIRTQNPSLLVTSQINTASNVIVDQPVRMNVGLQPCRLTCPGCGANSMTRVNRTANRQTHINAFILCPFGWCCCACCFPYCMGSCQTSNHHCKKCNKYLGSYKRPSCC